MIAACRRTSRWLAVGCLVLVGSAITVSARAGQDPFDLANKREELAKGAWRKINPTPIDPRIDFQVAVTPQQVRRGQTVKITITGIPRPGYHTYPFTQRASDPAQDEAQLSKWTTAQGKWFRPLWPITESDPQIEIVLGVGTLLQHAQQFTVAREYLILDEARPGLAILPVSLNLQVCNGNCIWGEPQFEVGLEVSDEPALPVSAELQKRLDAKAPVIAVIPVGGADTTAPRALTEPKTEKANPDVAKPALSRTPPPSLTNEPVRAEASQSPDGGLLSFLITGIGWAFVSLLTPCVFPMIPITVSFFLKQSHQSRQRTLALASVYSGTIVVVLTVGGVLLIHFLQPLSMHWATNYIFGALFIVFALSLFGMFELRLPTALANFTSSQEGRGGLVGTIFMALTFTIISFACVAPFYGGFILLAGKGQWLKLVLGAFAYSAAFASPFFLLALFPTLLRSLPKSGSWMNTLKVVMGFLELAAALKFLRAGELLYSGQASFLTYDLVLGLYVGLSLLCGLYLLNLYRLPHDDPPTGHLGVPRMLFSLVFLSLGLYLTPGLFKQSDGTQQRPRGELFAWLDSFLLPETSDHLSWGGNLKKTLQAAQDKRKLVFVDFTGLS